MSIPPISPVAGLVQAVQQAYGADAKPKRTEDEGKERQGQGHDDRPVTEVDVPDFVELAPGDILFREGDEGGIAYFVEMGEIEIYVMRGGDVVPVNRVGPGEVLGEMAVFDGGQRSACARAATSARLRPIDGKVLDDMLNQAPPGLRGLFRALINRLRDHVPENE